MTTARQPTPLTPAAQARYDAAPEWMRNASYPIAWERDPQQATAAQKRHMDSKRDPRKVRNNHGLDRA